jgi:MrcB-like, N-terminal domain/AAA domain (dynein-related subfamily)
MLSELFEDILKNWVNATEEQFSGHPIAMKLRDNLKNIIQKKLSEQGINYNIKASAGAGNWANVPWLSMLSPSMSQSTQEGIYPVYLFRADGSGLYLSLGFGTTNLKKIYGAAKAKGEASKITQHIHETFPSINIWRNATIDLRSSTDLGKSYEWGSAGAKFYPVNEIPSDEILLRDLFELIDIYKKIPSNFVDSINDKSKEMINSDIMIDVTNLPKPFILLAGISGTGKTRFVREQASATDPSGNNYCLVSVRPDWHEPSDLLGYVSRLSGKPEYVTTKVLDFIIRAWQIIAPEADAKGAGELEFSAMPYWLCLDEMNLAPVEQYFADYLSVLETRQFDNDEYSCEALLDKNLLNDLNSYPGNGLQKNLGLENNNNLWQYFLNHGIAIPPNLIVAGTVNMDETTHGFSRKVIDRALTIDFGEFFPNNYDHFFQSDIKIKPLTYSLLTQVSKDNLSDTFDSDGGKSIAFLDAVNSILRQTPFELAYRALNELLLQVACSKPLTKQHLQAVWDDFLMSKVLPRIDGDEDKLRNIKSDSDNNLLDSLSALLEEQLSEIWNDTRLDFYREKIDGSAIDDISCRSKDKLLWMKNRLEVNTFTSYWP